MTVSVHERQDVMFASMLAVAAVACLVALLVRVCLSSLSVSLSFGFRWTKSDNTTR